MDIAHSIRSALDLLGGVNPSSVKAVLDTVAKHIGQCSVHIDADAARGKPQAAWLDRRVSRPPHPHPDITLPAFLVLYGGMSAFISGRAQGLELLPCAARTPRLKKHLGELRRLVNIAVVELVSQNYPGMMSDALLARPTAPAAMTSPSQQPLASLPEPYAWFSLPITAQVPVVQPFPMSQYMANSARENVALSPDVLVQIFEHIHSMDVLLAFIAALPTVAHAARHLSRLSLTGSVAPAPLSANFPVLRILSLDAPLQRNPLFSAFALSHVTLDQSDPALWTAVDSRYTIDALGLPAVRTVRVQNATLCTVETLTARSRTATHLRCTFEGAAGNIEFGTANGTRRSFTRVGDAAISFILQPKLLGFLTRLVLDDWMPRGWIDRLFQTTTVALETFAVVLSATPPAHVENRDIELQRLTQYRGGGWTECRRLRMLELFATAVSLEVEWDDVRAFMEAAFSRRVDVGLHGVRLRKPVRV